MQWRWPDGASFCAETQASQLDEALRTAAAQFESVRTELDQHQKTLAALQEEVSKNWEAVAVSREAAKAQETLERHRGRRSRRREAFLALLGALAGVILGVVVDPRACASTCPCG
jgi:ferric-dicitrate binding protein FerR (iron transport regulator)